MNYKLTLNKTLVTGIMLVISITCVCCKNQRKENLKESSNLVEKVMNPKVEEDKDLTWLKEEARNNTIMLKREISFNERMGTPIYLTSHKVDEYNKQYVFVYKCNQEVADMNKMNHHKAMKEVLAEMKNNEASLNFMKLLLKKDYGVRFEVIGSITGDTIINSESPDEIRKMIELTTK